MLGFQSTKLKTTRFVHALQICAITVGASTAIAVSSVAAAENEFATHAELGLMQGFPPSEEKRVDRSNALFGVPYNRWSYQNMRSLYPTANIPTANQPVAINRKIDGGIDSLKVKRENGEVVDMPTWLRESYTDSLVVIQGDAIVWERYLNGMNADSAHQMMSVTKSFAGLFGLMAVSDGLLSEDDPVTKYVPELKASGGFGQATFRHVLDMTASVGFSEEYADPNSGITQYTKVLGFKAAPPEEIPANSIYEYLATLPTEEGHEDGDIFHYQTPKTDVVNWVTNRATGNSFQDYFYQTLWSKLGTDGETYVLLDRNGTLFAGGGLNATPNDLARFAVMMLNDGKFNGQQVVDPAVIKQLSDGANIEAFSKGPASAGVMGNKDWSYRAQWWVRHTKDHESFSAIGVNGQWIYLDVKRNVAIIKQSSQPEASANKYDEFNVNAFDAIIGYLTR
ncbi:MAG: serine hydrolase [Pseudomonadota bacterium]|nr:serine hydrolase [Pseudomonadota bacterium]